MPDIDPRELNLSPRDSPGLYLSTIQAATASFHSLFVNFIGPSQQNLVVNKGTRLEVYEIVSGGLLPCLEIPILGRISVMKSFRPTSLEVDLLACLTEKGDFFVLSWDSERSEIVTIIHANVNSPDCLPTRTSQLMSIDLRAQMIIVHVSVGMLQLLKFGVQGNSVQFFKAVPLKVMELEIVDLSFVDAVRANQDSALATLAILHRLPMKMARVKTYEISASGNNNYSLNATNYSITELTSDVIGLARVAAPRGGFLVYSPERIIYTNPQTSLIRKLVFTPTFFTCCCSVDDDGFRFLFGTSAGELYICLLICDSASETRNQVAQLKLERLGRTAVPSCLTYIDDGCVYVGSCHGDSSLICLSTDLVKETGNYFSTMQTFPSLAPMTDFVVTRPNSASEQSVLIGACGSAHEGSLKRICSGLEASCLLHLELGAQFPATHFSVIKMYRNFETHLLCLSSVLGQSVMFNYNFENDNIEEISLAPLNPRSDTICIFNIYNWAICQVTSQSAFFTSAAGDKIIQTYTNPDSKIIHASYYENFLALAFEDGTISLFRIDPGKGFSQLHTQQFPVQLSSLSLAEGNESEELFVLFSLWDNVSFGMIKYTNVYNGKRRARKRPAATATPDEVEPPIEAEIDSAPTEEMEVQPESLKLPQEQEKAAEYPQLQAETKLFRRDCSIRSTSLLQKRFALFASGDGQIFVIDINTGADDRIDCIKIGNQPITFYSIPSGQCILAHSNRETVHISVHNDRLVHSVVLGLPSEADVLFAPAKIGEISGFYVLYNDTIGFYVLAQSAIPRVHISSHPVGQSIHRLAAVDGQFLVSLEHNFPLLSVPMSHWPLMRSKLCLRDIATLETVDTFAFEFGNEQGRFAEIGWCCCVGELDGVEGSVLVVGTCIASDDTKAERGRLLVFQVAEGRKLKLISVNDLSNGGVKAVSIVRGLVLAAVRGSNVLFKWDYAQERRLVKASSSGGHIEGTAFDVQENVIAAGDALTSVSFCYIHSEAGGASKIIEFARDFQDNYITSLQLVDFSSALASDLTGNLLLLQVIRDESLNLNAAVAKGNIHLADMVNTIRRANFLSRPAKAEQSFLATSASGAIYALHQLSSKDFKVLNQLQRNLATLIKPIGGIKHNEFRRFFNGERTLERTASFIDGDLLVRFLALNQTKQSEAMGLASKSQMPEKITEISCADLVKIIESFSYGI